MMNKIIPIVLVLLLSTVAYSQGALKINIDELSNNEGQVVLLLFKEGQELGHSKTPFRKIVSEISDQKCTITIDGLAKGEYAFIVFHDEDDNGELLTNWMGMPKEGIGKSGSHRARPTYENSKFVFPSETKVIDVVIKYL